MGPKLSTQACKEMEHWGIPGPWNKHIGFHIKHIGSQVGPNPDLVNYPCTLEFQINVQHVYLILIDFPSYISLLGTTRLLILMIYSYLHNYLELRWSQNMGIEAWKMNNQGEM